jgi:8-oxo-dGTP pyrophosphatase MutT (NUDIX family)
MSEAVGAVILLRSDGAALLQHRDDKAGIPRRGMWVKPGGHCDDGESIEACARREMCEETEYRCADLHWLTELLDEVAGWPAYALTVFWAHYDGVQPVRCGEGQALKFVRREDAADYPMPDFLLQLWDLALAASRQHVTR